MLIELEIGETIVKAGVQLRYLGGGRFVPVDEPLAKRFSHDGDDLTGSVRDALARHGIDTPCN